MSGNAVGVWWVGGTIFIEQKYYQPLSAVLSKP